MTSWKDIGGFAALKPREPDPPNENKPSPGAPKELTESQREGVSGLLKQRKFNGSDKNREVQEISHPEMRECLSTYPPELRTALAAAAAEALEERQSDPDRVTACKNLQTLISVWEKMANKGTA